MISNRMSFVIVSLTQRIIYARCRVQTQPRHKNKMTFVSQICWVLCHHWGLLLAKDKGIVDLMCYSDSLLCINIINWSISKFHVYAVLIQDIKELMEQINATISHTLREGNHYADFMAKQLIRHDSLPAELLPLL